MRSTVAIGRPLNRTMPRSYPVIDHRIGPQKHYDVIVIGAGIGGLVAANLLAMQGAKVLLVEQHYVVGGYCSTFQRKGFTFDAASHFYPLLGDPTTLTGKLLHSMGSRTQWVKMDPVDQFHFPDGTKYAVPSDLETYLQQLKQKFPDERKSIGQFFAQARKLYLWGLLHYFRNVKSHRLTPYLGMTVREALDQHFQSDALKLLLTADSPHWGSPPNRTSFVFDSMLRLSYFQGNYYPDGGSQKFADELAQLFTDRGGEILLRTNVRRITVEAGVAKGVVLELGPQRDRRRITVQSSACLSNADMRLTVYDLVGATHFDQDYLEHLDRLRPTYACFLSHIGVRGISRQELERAHGYYWNGWNSDRMTSGDFGCKVFVPSLYSESIAPKGSHVVVIQKVTDVDFDSVQDWQAHKQAVESFVLDQVEAAIPGFRDRIVVCLSATAHTSHRFTLNYQGAMLGWEMSPDQLGDDRPDISSPIKNLYFAGQWVQPGGGITPVIVSSKLAVDRILGSDVGSERSRAHAGNYGSSQMRPVEL